MLKMSTHGKLLQLNFAFLPSTKQPSFAIDSASAGASWNHWNLGQVATTVPSPKAFLSSFTSTANQKVQKLYLLIKQEMLELIISPSGKSISPRLADVHFFATAWMA